MYENKMPIDKCVKLENKHITRDTSIEHAIYANTSSKATFLGQ